MSDKLYLVGCRLIDSPKILAMLVKVGENGTTLSKLEDMVKLHSDYKTLIVALSDVDNLLEFEDRNSVMNLVGEGKIEGAFVFIKDFWLFCDKDRLVPFGEKSDTP